VSLDAVSVAGLVAGLAVVVWAMMRAARLKPPALVVTATALITLGLIAAWLAAPERGGDLAPLIGTGLGALAAGVTAVFSDRDPPPPPAS
jgi:hypothetical protein